MDDTQRKVVQDLVHRCQFAYDHDAFWTLDDLLGAELGGDFVDTTVEALFRLVEDDAVSVKTLLDFVHIEKFRGSGEDEVKIPRPEGTVWVVVSPCEDGETDIEVLSERPITPLNPLIAPHMLRGVEENWPGEYTLYAANIDGGDSELIEHKDSNPLNNIRKG